MDQLIENLRAVLGTGNVLAEPDELLVYECDGLPHHKYLPRAVVFPSSTEETAEVMGHGHATVERDWKMARAWLRRKLE